LWTVKKLKTELLNTGLRSVRNTRLIQAAFNSKREVYSRQRSIQNSRLTQASVQFKTRGSV